jgi:hypothetical protein
VFLFWPAMSVLGFLVLAGFVIALGTASTTRYERERQPSGEPPPEPNVAGEQVPDDGSGLGAAYPTPATGVAGSGSAASELRSPVGVATHPAGRRTVSLSAPTGWWLVDESDDAGGTVLAGPFPDTLEAECAALVDDLPATTRTVFGARRADGALVRRHSPEELAWLAELGEQLDRLGDDWDSLLSDTDELTTLVVDVTAALVDAGLTLHDCDGHTPTSGAAGGVCLTPVGRSGILVSWRPHDRMSLHHVRGTDVGAAVQRAMNGAVAEVLTQTGFAVEPFGATGCHLVTGAEF